MSAVAQGVATGDPRLDVNERRALVRGTVYRILGMPALAAIGLVNTAIVVRETGAELFGLVTLISTITLMLPFVDLGIGSTVMSASATISGPQRDPNAIDAIRKAYRVLGLVCALVIGVALAVMASDSWALLLGLSSGAVDRWAITVAAVVFALTIPARLGTRILVGIDRNDLATLAQMSSSLFGILLTLGVLTIGAQGIWYAVAPLAGMLIGQLIATVIALRLSGLGWLVFAPVAPSARGRRLLQGSVWLFVAGVGVPLGMQGGRLLLAHLSTPTELAGFALMAQLYGAGWSVLSTAAIAYWPIFVKRRGATEATVRLWWRITAVFAAVATACGVGLILFGPMVTSGLSGGRIAVSGSLCAAFGLLLVVQAAHLPSGVLLTKPNEARWQACCIAGMAAIALVGGIALAGPAGATGVVLASAAGVFFAQLVPDLLMAPGLVRRRDRIDRPRGRHRLRR